MKETNLKATVRRPKTTNRVQRTKSAGYVYENLLNRDFHAISSKSKMGN